MVRCVWKEAEDRAVEIAPWGFLRCLTYAACFRIEERPGYGGHRVVPPRLGAVQRPRLTHLAVVSAAVWMRLSVCHGTWDQGEHHEVPPRFTHRIDPRRPRCK
jgi:hypothetical protein